MVLPGLGVQARLWVALLGLALPFLLGVLSVQPPSASQGAALFSAEAFSFPPFLPILLLLAAWGLRFWDLSGLFRWPNWDEAAMGTFAAQLDRHWEWKYFFGFGEEPPSFIWATAALLKLGVPPLPSLWFPLALVSALGLGMAWAAARQFFSRSLSLLLMGLVGLSYLTLLLGRLGLPLAWMPLWESVLLYLWGRYRNTPEKSPSAQRKWLLLFGLCAGFGFNLTHFWITALGLTLALGWTLAKKKNGMPGLLLLSSAFVLGIFPFLWAAVRESYGGNLLQHSFLGASTAWRPWEILGSYFSAYCWGFPQEAYVPQAMGLWNPLLDSFLFLGLMEWIRLRKSPLVRGFWILLALLYLPVGLVVGLDPFRLLQVLPLWFLAVATGLQALLVSLPKDKRLGAALAVLAVSGAVDGSRLVFPYLGVSELPVRLAAVDKSPEKFQAFQALRDAELKQGPGLVFSEMIPESGDFSLAYMASASNAAWAPEDQLGKAKWIALLTPFYDATYFTKNYPDSRVFFLPSSVLRLRSDHVLVVLPVTPQNLPVLRKCREAYRLFWDLSYQVLVAPNGQSRQPVLKELLGAYPGFPKDPYLQACFFEKLLFNYTAEKTFHPEDDWVSWGNFSEVFRSVYALSYKNLVLETKYGDLLALENQDSEATKVYQEALRLSPEDPMIRERLRQLSLPPHRRGLED